MLALESNIAHVYDFSIKNSYEFAPAPLVDHYLDRDINPEIGKYFRECVEALFAKVQPLGFTMCIETAPYKPQEYNRHPDSLEIAEFVRSFNSPFMQMTIDVNHSNLREDLKDTAENCRGLIKNIHVSNNYGEKEEHRPVRDGIIDMKYAFQALRDNGYSGPCNLEFVYPDREKFTDSATLAEERKYLENLLWS